ncbi:uncharacterized protein LOC131944056 [Physella acuta]|uniref:uncharacterized protein LOC131944056 n=1 Tax=Physella acuta TaxID=109671 RepID=UPI0027DB9E41|nr:uncharacterized protein LOC131944056 [Physella acuta]
MFKRALIFFLGFNAAVCEHIRQTETCARLQDCVNPFDRVKENFLKDFIVQKTYHKFCQSTPDFGSCYFKFEDECTNDEFKDTLLSKVLLARFLCSNESVKEISALAGNECPTNDQKMVKLIQSYDGCMQQFDDDIQSADKIDKDISSSKLCLLASKLFTCVRNTSTAHCGQRVGSFLTRMWDAEGTFHEFQLASCTSRS